MPNYAIFTFRHAGPIKNWSDMRGAQVHNSREKPIAHAQSEDAPVHLIGSGNLVRDVRGLLARHGIDPDRLRKNGVIAYEAVITATGAFFLAGSDQEQLDRLVAWAEAQKEFVIERYGANRVASLVLHTDEMTPHMHLVVLPLQFGPDGRCPEREPHWRLAGRMISGPGKFDALQDDYATTMAKFGLVRGEQGSGRKHRPTREYLRDLEAEKIAAEKAKQEAREQAAKLRAAIARHDELLAEQGRLLEAAERDRAAARKARRAAEVERALVAKDAELLDGCFGALHRALGRAVTMHEAMKAVQEHELSPAARAVLRSVMGVQEAARTIVLPQNDLAIEAQAAFLERAALGR